jgi:small subunit ribosomal protein S16
VAVRIRLRRIGKKKQPQYRLVAAETAGPRDGRFIEVIGHYNPRVDPSAVRVNEERALWWLRQGAQPSDVARSLLMKTGIWEKFKQASDRASAPPSKAEELEQPETLPEEEGEERSE